MFFVPLQGLDVNRDIDSIVDEFVRIAGRTGDCLPENPVNWVHNAPNMKLLLIFDGLDEVARPDGADLEVTRKFLESLRFWLSQTNGNREPKVKAVVLGRPAAAEDAALKLGGLDGDRLLYVAPLCVLDEERLKREADEAIEICDPEGLARRDDRRVLWDKYAGFDKRYGDEEPEALKEAGFEDLTIEPLLLYLLMFSGLAGKDWPEAKENRNRIYEAIFAKVHRRDKKEKPHITVADEGDFFTLMECLGLAAWQNGGRTGSDEDFAKIRDGIYAPEKQELFKDLDCAKLSYVAVQFYTHQGGREGGYAFIHKSFGEYLTARALVKISEVWCDDHGKRSRWDSFAEDWLRLTGGQRLTPEILTFMIDEARLRVKPHGRDDADRKRAQRLVGQLADVATLTLRKGFPAHRVNPITRGDADWRRCESNQRNAETVLYATMHAWAEAAYPREAISRKEGDGGWEPGPIKVTWHEQALTPAAAMLGRARDQWGNGTIAKQIFARWDFSGQSFGIIDLNGVDLFGADLGRADLGRANLFGADLGRADLGRANLEGADLEGADLEGAKCSRFNIDSARLHFAKCSGAIDLSQEQIDKALGNSATELHEDMTHPPHWLTDD